MMAARKIAPKADAGGGAATHAVVEPEHVKRLQRIGPLRVPWFVTVWREGRPEYRVTENWRVREAIRREVCWICGGALGRRLSFAIGPMCTVNRLSAEPPQHRDCAVWAAGVCPFMSDPGRMRRDKNLPDGAGAPGVMLTRNPGAVAVYTTRTAMPEPHPGGYLFRLGEPTEVLWFTEGRAATREEAREAFGRALPALLEIAAQEGKGALQAAQRAINRAYALLPA